jgi:hypothetical protein
MSQTGFGRGGAEATTQICLRRISTKMVCQSYDMVHHLPACGRLYSDWARALHSLLGHADGAQIILSYAQLANRRPFRPARSTTQSTYTYSRLTVH